MKLSEYLDYDLLCKHVNARVVNVQHHRFLPLAIYNYGQKATFDGIWDDVTEKCRGLIVDQSTDQIIERPFRKFFNLNTDFRPETKVENLPTSQPEILDKLDGSLGILYRYNGCRGIATRGSFESDQAAWASAWYEKHLGSAVWPVEYTPLFEIIYADNRVVVKYDYEGLVLLGAVHRETGAELPHVELFKLATLNGCRLASRFHKTVSECSCEDAPNLEGYVASWHYPDKPSLKVKIKFAEYCRLHHLITGISPKEIWRMLTAGETFDELTTNVPTHYADWVNAWKASLESEYGRIEQKAKAIYATCPLPKDGANKDLRKALAEFFTLGDRKQVSGVLFKMLDGQPYDDAIWKMVRPMTAGLDPFRRENE